MIVLWLNLKSHYITQVKKRTENKNFPNLNHFSCRHSLDIHVSTIFCMIYHHLLKITSLIIFLYRGSFTLETCSLPRDRGIGFASFVRYAYDKDRRACTRFYYGGFGGNNNNFKTLEACNALCGKGKKEPFFGNLFYRFIICTRFTHTKKRNISRRKESKNLRRNTFFSFCDDNIT